MIVETATQADRTRGATESACTCPGCTHGPCVGVIRRTIAAECEVPPGCPNRVRFADDAYERPRACGDVPMTISAAAIAALTPLSARSEAIAGLLRARRLVILDPRVRGPIRGSGSARPSDRPKPGGVPPKSKIPIEPWSARWDREKVSWGETAQMILVAPDLPPGREVVFDVFQDGYGYIGSVKTTSFAGGARAPWSDWYAPERVTYQVQLHDEEPFPPVTFRFLAKAEGRSEESGTLLYADYLDLKVSYSDDHASGDIPANQEYVIHSPWGTSTRRTDSKGAIFVDGLPPGGVSVTMMNYTLLRFGRRA